MKLRFSELIPEIDLVKSRQPLTLDVFARELLPPILCYYATAVLVISPHTFSIRLALLPITLWGIFRACTQIDVVAGWPEYDRLVYLNQGLVVRFVVLILTHIGPHSNVQLSDYFSNNCLQSMYMDIPTGTISSP